MNNKICPNCGAPLKFVQGGISEKTGKKYPAFWVCSKRCGFSFTPRPPKNQEFQKAVDNLDLPATKRDLGIIRGDLKKILDILTELEKKSVIYPSEIGKEPPEEIIEKEQEEELPFEDEL